MSAIYKPSNNNDHRFTFERPGSKYTCPGCLKKREFTRYIDKETGEPLADHIGRCNNEGKCGYHKTPSEFFHEGGQSTIKCFKSTSFTSPSSPKVYIPIEILKQSLTAYERNGFVKHLRTLFNSEIVSKLIEAYCLGSSNGRWPGACVFWFIDVKGRIHAGQVKQFDETGHTAKYLLDGEKQSCTTWIHSILKNRLNPTPDWLSQYVEQEKKVGCFFGEHLLKNSIKPVAIVEAPATAIVASVYLPQCTWIAAGAKGWLNTEKCEVLKGRRVTLYPDLKAYEDWKPIADKMGFKISDLLEKIATNDEKEKGLDLRDYLERHNVEEFLKLYTHPEQRQPEVKLTVSKPEYDLSGEAIHPVKATRFRGM
jgi:hypothetical protein